jgi:hypothetical protein
MPLHRNTRLTWRDVAMGIGGGAIIVVVVALAMEVLGIMVFGPMQ